jgi:hypothetical protein
LVVEISNPADEAIEINNRPYFLQKDPADLADYRRAWFPDHRWLRMEAVVHLDSTEEEQEWGEAYEGTVVVTTAGARGGALIKIEIPAALVRPRKCTIHVDLYKGRELIARSEAKTIAVLPASPTTKPASPAK